MVANYAEQHTNNQEQYANHESHNKNSILPISLRILHMLLEKNLRIELSDKPLDLVEILSIKVNDDSGIPGLPTQEYYEHLAVEEIVKIILERSNNQKISIYKLIDRIEHNQDTKIVKFYSNIKIHTREDKLNRILKNSK